MGAFLQQGLTPGPTLFTEHSEIAWAIIASLFVGNVILLILNVPLVRVWTAILQIPEKILTAIILLFLGETTNFQSNRLAVAGFLAGVASFLLALVCFLTETLLATRLLNFHLLQQEIKVVK